MKVKTKKRYNLGDIVKTKLGNLAVVVEISGGEYSVNFLENNDDLDYNAWHQACDFTYVCNIYVVIEQE